MLPGKHLVELRGEIGFLAVRRGNACLRFRNRVIERLKQPVERFTQAVRRSADPGQNGGGLFRREQAERLRLLENVRQRGGEVRAVLMQIADQILQLLTQRGQLSFGGFRRLESGCSAPAIPCCS